MWDTAALDRQFFGSIRKTSKSVVSHISRKTSEIWGTRGLVEETDCSVDDAGKRIAS
jgi:hypothetical protein